MLKEDNLYISGIVNMASYNLNPSYMDVDCLIDLDSALKKYNIKNENIIINRIDINSLFKDIFNIEEKAINNLIYLITKEAGNINCIYELNEEEFKKISNDNSKYKFFFLENFYIIEFDKMTICFMVGNDE